MFSFATTQNIYTKSMNPVISMNYSFIVIRSSTGLIRICLFWRTLLHASHQSTFLAFRASLL